MPKLDGTGPLGQGPANGRSLGPCGIGIRRGFRCLRNRFFSPKNELSALEEEEKLLEEELKAVREEKTNLRNQQK